MIFSWVAKLLLFG